MWSAPYNPRDKAIRGLFNFLVSKEKERVSFPKIIQKDFLSCQETFLIAINPVFLNVCWRTNLVSELWSSNATLRFGISGEFIV